MEYKDALGVDIKFGDMIVYTSSKGNLQLGRVVELSTSKGSVFVSNRMVNRDIPALKIRGARKEWQAATNSVSFSKMSAISTITKLENVVVLGKNLPAMLTLM